MEREPISVDLPIERLREAEAPDPERESLNDGDYFMYINVTDQNIVSGENANPVMTLRMRYDGWKAGGGGRNLFDASGG